MDDDLESRLSKVAKRRGGHFHVRPHNSPEDPRTAADDLARSLRFRPIGEAWDLMSPTLTARTLAYLLHRWLAYPREFMPPADAQALADRFVGSFGPDPICLTNAEWRGGEPGPLPDASGPSLSWMPITKSTFDAGVVCFGGGQVGVLWFEEDD